MKKKYATEAECLVAMEPVAKALIEIRDMRLFRGTAATFEEYLVKNHGKVKGMEMLEHLALWEQAVAERN